MQTVSYTYYVCKDKGSTLRVLPGNIRTMSSPRGLSDHQDIRLSIELPELERSV
jgi:hypothetical protein